MQKKHFGFFGCNDVHHERFSFGKGIGCAEGLTRFDFVQNARISPKVGIFDYDASGQYDAERYGNVARAENNLALCKLFLFKTQRIEYGRDFFGFYAAEQHCF